MKIKKSLRFLAGLDNLSSLGVSISQTSPAIIFAAFFGFRFSSRYSYAFFFEFLLFAYGVLVTSFWFTFDPYPLEAIFRQSVSFGFGLMIFFYFLKLSKSNKNIFSYEYLCLLVLVSFSLSLYQVIVGGERARGLSTEPSHLGDLLVLFVFPLLFSMSGRKRFFVLFVLLALFSLVLTSSATSVLKLLTFLFFSLFFARPIITSILFAFVLVLIAALYNSDFNNYAFNMLRSDIGSLVSLAPAELSGSFLDRFAGIFVLFSSGFDTKILFGGGIGCELTCFFPLLDPTIKDIILSVKSFPPTISPFLVKEAFYFGVIPCGLIYGFYAYLFFKKRYILSVTEKGALITVFLSSLYSIGPFWLIYTWFWKAYLVQKHEV